MKCWLGWFNWTRIWKWATKIYFTLLMLATKVWMTFLDINYSVIKNYFCNLKVLFFLLNHFIKEDVAKRLIDQQVAPLMENIPNHFLVNELFSLDALSFDFICYVTIQLDLTNEGVFNLIFSASILLRDSLALFVTDTGMNWKQEVKLKGKYLHHWFRNCCSLTFQIVKALDFDTFWLWIDVTTL